MKFFPVRYKLCENHLRIINFWMTVISLKHYLPTQCRDFRKFMLFPRFFEVFHPFLSKAFCNRSTASFQRFFISKSMVSITALRKLYSNRNSLKKLFNLKSISLQMEDDLFLVKAFSCQLVPTFLFIFFEISLEWNSPFLLSKNHFPLE